MVKSYVLFIAVCILLQFSTPPSLTQPPSNCQNSSTQAPIPVGNSPVTWATLLYRLRKISSESSGHLSKMRREDLGISLLYLGPSDRAQIRIEIVGSTAQGLIAADCWNDPLKEISIHMYHVSDNERLTWQELEDPALGYFAFHIFALLADRYVVPNQLGELESQRRYLEKIRTTARGINAKTNSLSLGITDEFRLFATEYAFGELVFWVYYRQKLLVD